MAKGLIGLCAVVLCGVLAMEEADARGRLGAGRSTGVQRSIPGNAPASTPARPAQQQAAPNQAAGSQAAAPQPQPTGLSRWMPMLGGLALGGLLGYLFAGNWLGGLLLLALLAVGAVLLFRGLARRRAEPPQRMQYAGMDEGPLASPARDPGALMQSAGGQQAAFDTASFLRGAKMNFVKLQA